MLRRCVFALSILALAAFGESVFAQARSGIVSTTAARQFGLERMWVTQVGFDSARGRLAGIAQHVSSTRVHTVVEVGYEGRVYRFSEWDLDAYGNRIGVEEAKKNAKDKVDQLIAEAAVLKKKSPPPKTTVRVIPEINLYASSDRGTVQAIDAETGRTRWTVSVGDVNQITTGPGANDQFVAVLNGSKLFVLKAGDGTIAFQRTVVGGVAAAPALAEALCYVPTVSGNVEVFSLEKPNMPSHSYRSHGRTMLQPIASNRTVAWTTDAGVLYSANGLQKGLRFRLSMPDASPVSPAFIYPDRLIAASVDGHLYCVHEALGEVLWRVSTGEPVDTAPFAVGNTAFLITGRGGMFAIDGSTGREKWWTGGVRGYLAGTPERLYCTDLSRNILILDTKTGRRIGTIAAPNIDVRYANTFTDRILLGTNSGMLQMFRETGRPWPYVHANVEAEKSAPVEVKQTPADGAPPPAGDMPPMNENPFDDPFAGPPAAKPPGKPMPAAPEADPFGADPFGEAAMPKPVPMPKPAPMPGAPGGENKDPFGEGPTMKPDDDPFK